MRDHAVVSREELAATRKELPWVRVDKEYEQVGTELPTGLREGPGWNEYPS